MIRVDLAQLEPVLGRTLSQEQAVVVQAPLSPGVVIAGAGSGKTSTMVARVIWLVANALVAPEGVLGLTFTTKAADELAGRVRLGLRALRAHGLLPPSAEQADLEPTISTYHAYAGRLVREHAMRLGREPSARLVTPATSWQLAARAVSTYDGPMEQVDWSESTVIRAVLALAGDLAEHLRTPEDVRVAGRRLDEQAARATKLQKAARDLVHCQRVREQLLPLVEAYSGLKRQRELLDFGDVVALAAELARSSPPVRETERAAFPVVLLDEYQDTGAAQEVLLSSLFGAGHALTAVGDPCQSIYGWRGASAGTLRRFPRSFGATGRPATLSTTYRSGGRILLLANALSEPLRVQEPSVPVPLLQAASGREGDGQVRCALLSDVQAEAGWVADGVVTALAELDTRAGDPGQGTPGGDDAGRTWSRAAVLCRKRSMFPRLRAAFEQRGVPVEVVGLGGLLAVPEVADVLATLRVLDDATADASLLRLLTGPRWRVGPRDLAALGRRARALVRTGGALPDDPVEAVVLGVDDSAAGSLVDALDDLPRTGLSELGRTRLEALRDELRGLRRRADQSLPDLVGDVERTLGLDVEVAARLGVRDVGAARADLDAFADAAADFAGDTAQDGSGEAVLSAFLAFLTAAEDEENGLDTGAASGADTVKLMTVHAAKGLEWPVVAVPGLAGGVGSTVFPASSQISTSWTRNARLLPFPLRGDVEDLPPLVGLEPGDVTAHAEANAARNAREERRLAYVAVTRAEHVLLCAGHHWGEGKLVLGPSEFLLEAREACLSGAGVVDTWCDPPPATNPITADVPDRPWPGPGPPAAPEVQAAAMRVRELLADPQEVPGVQVLSPGAQELIGGWDEDLARLAEEAQRRRARRTVAVLPSQLPVSTLVQLARDQDGLARHLLRPLPRRPSPVTRRGTAFHSWLEQVYEMPQLLDPSELPGAADDSAGQDEDMAALQEAFRSSPWWGRTPAEIEVPFETEVGGILIRGRMDAVFVDPGGGYDVVDWKTGRRPHGVDATAAAVQLSAYRLAWAALSGTPLAQVRAAFHYVRSGETVRPVDLLDAHGLRELVRQVPLDG